MTENAKMQIYESSKEYSEKEKVSIKVVYLQKTERKRLWKKVSKKCYDKKVDKISGNAIVGMSIE